MTATLDRGLTRFEMDLSDELVPHLDREDLIKLADELSNYGIDTIEQFQDAFYYRTESYRPDEEFAQYLSEEINCDEVPDYIQGCIDWQVVWDSHFCFDFWSVCIDGTTYYFFNS